MEVDRAGALAQRRFRVGERLLDEDRLAGEAGRRIALVDVELVLALDRHIDPRLGRVEIEMPRAEMHAVARLDRRELRQHAALEGECLDRAGVHRIVAGRIVAARDQDDLLVVRRRANLVGVFAGVEPVGLFHPLAERAVAVDAVDGERARVVVGGQQIFAGDVDAGVDRTRRQAHRLARAASARRSRDRCGRRWRSSCRSPPRGRRRSTRRRKIAATDAARRIGHCPAASRCCASPAWRPRRSRRRE